MMERVQKRILGATPQLEAPTPKELLRQIRKVLIDALADGKLKIQQHVIYSGVKLINEEGKPEYTLSGGTKDFKRRPENAILCRDDQAWLHFTMTLRSTARDVLEMLAYDFELVFPPDHKPEFVRLDLNPPEHENEKRGLRSHVHPGSDDLQLPAPWMTPVEILKLMLYGLRPRDPNRPRSDAR